jgi:hypothetical protein
MVQNTVITPIAERVTPATRKMSKYDWEWAVDPYRK